MAKRCLPAEGLFLKSFMCNAVTMGTSVSSFQFLPPLGLSFYQFIIHCCQANLPKNFHILFLYLLASSDFALLRKSWPISNPDLLSYTSPALSSSHHILLPLLLSLSSVNMFILYSRPLLLLSATFSQPSQLT